MNPSTDMYISIPDIVDVTLNVKCSINTCNTLVSGNISNNYCHDCQLAFCPRHIVCKSYCTMLGRRTRYRCVKCLHKKLDNDAETIVAALIILITIVAIILMQVFIFG